MIANANSWAWLAVVLFIVILRLISRSLHKSFKGLQLEDALMVFTTACYIVLIVILYETARYGTNQIPLSETGNIDPRSIPNLIYGSKLVIVSEQMWLATVWACKASLLMLYSSMTMGLNRHRLVLVLGVFCVLSYIVIEILFFACWCRPFSAYWSVPPKSMQCSVYRNHLILVLALNVSSDLLMMFIPLPILIGAKLSLTKKITLCAVFSLGAFVIICCILSKYYSIAHPYGHKWEDWYVREAGTAIIVANIPHIWPLTRRLLNARDFFSNGSFARTRKSTTDLRPQSDMPMASIPTGKSSLMRSMLSRSASDDVSDRPINQLEIWEHKNFQVTEEPGYPASNPESSECSRSADYNPVLSPYERDEMRTKATVTTTL